MSIENYALEDEFYDDLTIQYDEDEVGIANDDNHRNSVCF